ncbi:unnamed protein product [Sphagnum jensenii]|uniref:Alpha 1,4-glycosyltransferase domain-containing protein n=1 Tax=Sphagnum jensenii TaxID=128206 RepID=A0ABP0VVJ5_9BRYO
MPRPRRLSSSSSLTRSPSRLSFSSSSAAATAVAAVRNEHARIYTCLIAGGLLLLASVTFLQAHLASAPQGSNLDPLDSDSNSEMEEKKQGLFFWDHTLGVRKKSLKNVEHLGPVLRTPGGTMKLGTAATNEGLLDLEKHEAASYNSDDETLDEEVQRQLEDVVEIEDALLLNEDGPVYKPVPRLPDKIAGKYAQKGGSSYDPINPVNIPMLQDPDTGPDTWMTKSDKAMLKALRVDGYGQSVPLQPNQGLQSRANTQGLTHWRHVAGTRPSLTFTAFMQQFLHQDTCSIRVFMAWTTPPWSLTVRHQRTLESLFHFHPNACVVVFSETLETDFFKTFVQEGFKVAVVQPDLPELLANTPTDIFTTVWVRWREIPLYYIHYTDLLRLVALYKYGGVYMDMDVILLKPLDSLHNAIGSEILANGEVRLNGAVMVFNKSSPFLRECLEEFTATYDDTLLEWNGAELVTRVANFSIRKGGKKWSEDPEALQIQPPFAFFPLTSSSILRYFVAPTDKQQEEEEKQLLGKIFEEAFTTHYWNRLTAQLVPENGSLIETVLNQHCLTCTDIL